MNLPISGTSGIEPRTGGSTGQHTLIINFGNELTSLARVNVSSGTARVANSGIGPDRHQYVVNLSDVTDAQQIMLTMTDVLDANENYSPAVSLQAGFLLGDANSDGVVNSGDATITSNLSGESTDATNFRSDFNIDGSINSGDATIVRSRSGQVLLRPSRNARYLAR